MTNQSNQELQALLPFYVNGSLSLADRELVEIGLEQDTDLQAALEGTREIYSQMQAEPLPHRVDTGFARLMKAIETTPQDPVAPATDRTAARPASLVLKLALAAACLALAVQATIFWRGDMSVGLASGGVQGQLTVAFQPSATEAQIRAVLMELDLQIVSGPSSLGLYQLKSDDPAEDIERLTGRGDVVESVENAMD